MEYVGILGREVSRLMLGTVQFGQEYGVANKTGMPSYEEVEEMLGFAFDSGINALDTAYGYGESEERLGRFLSGYDRRDEIFVVTKVNHLDTESGDLKEQMDASIETSLKRLQMDSIPGYMLHKADNMDSDFVMDYLNELKERGVVREVGVSIYTPEQAHKALSFDLVSAVQIPFNVFDLRLVKSGFLAEAKAKGVAVFARSSFLQGVVLMPNEDLPEKIKDFAPYKDEFVKICESEGRTINEVAFKFPLAQEGLTSVLFGVDNISQLKENIEVYNTPELDSGLVAKLRDAFKDVPERLINPARWS